MTWDDPDSGGDSSRVQDQLHNVQQICGTYRSFAAILANGTVVTWGYPDYGGESSIVQDQLKNVQEICSTDSAFAAILADGTMVAWGIQSPRWGQLRSPRFVHVPLGSFRHIAGQNGFCKPSCITLG